MKLKALLKAKAEQDKQRDYSFGSILSLLFNTAPWEKKPKPAQWTDWFPQWK